MPRCASRSRISKAQAETMAEPHRMTNNRGWESVSVVVGSGARHRSTLQLPPRLDNAITTAPRSVQTVAGLIILLRMRGGGQS
jgi:hypothetical protein